MIKHKYSIELEKIIIFNKKKDNYNYIYIEEPSQGDFIEGGVISPADCFFKYMRF